MAPKKRKFGETEKHRRNAEHRRNIVVSRRNNENSDRN